MTKPKRTPKPFQPDLTLRVRTYANALRADVWIIERHQGKEVGHTNCVMHGFVSRDMADYLAATLGLKVEREHLDMELEAG